MTRRCTGTSLLAGTAAVVAVPLHLIGASRGSELAEVQVSSSVAGDVLHTAALPDAMLPSPQLQFVVARDDADPTQLTYETSTAAVEGAFAAFVPWSADILDHADHRLWTRACLGAVCGPARSLALPRP